MDSPIIPGLIEEIESGDHIEHKHSIQEAKEEVLQVRKKETFTEEEEEDEEFEALPVDTFIGETMAKQASIEQDGTIVEA